ncbi:hypothetical protein K1T71_009753 [Dendrolimus kikuchii]|uniref:Uncharacterized protein n=1 Tax=Dendrolimus kikuchii TaxID=765133 RepID=A0ACC1CSQ6_9NEOP|nr:hypothetical protein K1T71_009753 [Dendrolimus kikuchii]
MSTTEITDSPIGLKLKVLHYVRLFIAAVAHFVFTLYYGNEGEKIPPITDDILKQPAIEVARRIRNKEVTSLEVLETCIRRIKDINSPLNCVVEDRFELALKEAREADELIRSGSKSMEQLEKEQPFLGVPFTTKDCIAVKGLHQTAGIVLRKDFIASEDADTIRLLREKGAIIIAITNVPEVCMWWETHNHIYGRTKNPYNTTRIVGGSSGGEGCLQAAAGSVFGIGSDIGGSIRMPCFFNGIFGHKPSRNIVSNIGQYPIPESDLLNSFLGVGPMTRHAVDLKPILKIISGANAIKLNLDTPVDLKTIKFFYQINNNAPLSDPVDADIVLALSKVVEFLKRQHQINAEEKNIRILSKTIPIWLANMKTPKRFGEFLMENETKGRLLIEIVKNVLGLSANTFIALVTALVDYSGASVGSDKYYHFLKKRDEMERIFSEMLGEDGVFLFPTHPTPAPYHNEPVFKPFNFGYTAAINSLGMPATTVPLGLSREGLPIGIQVIANYNQDRLCLAVAEELEKAFGGWVEPHNL